MADNITIIKPSKLGGWSSSPQPANKDVEILTSWMQNISEAKTGANYKTFKAVEYISQVVAGMNYLIKVDGGGDDYVHLMIFQSPLLGDSVTTTFKGAKGGYKKSSPLNPNEFTH